MGLDDSVCVGGLWWGVVVVVAVVEGGVALGLIRWVEGEGGLVREG